MGLSYAIVNMSFQLPTPSDTPKDMEHDGSSPASYANHSTTWTPADGLPPITTNPSRKRGRDETDVEAESERSYFPSIETPVTMPEEEPIYGEGMMLLNPKTGLSVSAESQTGTWYEEEVDQKAVEEEVMAANARPAMLTSRKSAKLSQGSIRLPIDFSAASAPASPPKTAQDRPEVDEATMALGIGWTKMASEDESIQAAARGWAKYLENHYSRNIHGAQILLKSSGLNAYLVGCQEGFFLFGDDLLEGKLVGRTWETCLQNLKSSPMAFEGEEVLRAERTPGPDAVQSQLPHRNIMENWADFDRINHPTAIPVAHGGMDLD